MPLAVRTLGQGPPTVLLHGLLGSDRYWGGGFDRLADSGLLLAPDLLGFGAFPRPKFTPSCGRIFPIHWLRTRLATLGPPTQRR
jgi:pimeloyl-ACP methyl ester carboxylesterase